MTRKAPRLRFLQSPQCNAIAIAFSLKPAMLFDSTAAFAHLYLWHVLSSDSYTFFFNTTEELPWRMQTSLRMPTSVCIHFCFVSGISLCFYGFIYTNEYDCFALLWHLQIAQVLSLNLLENPMHVKGARISKFVPLPPKALTLVLFIFILLFYASSQKPSTSSKWHYLSMWNIWFDMF